MAGASGNFRPVRGLRAEGPFAREAVLYLVRFSYDVRPVDRDAALAFIRKEVAAAHARGLVARLLVPLTRAHGGAALQFEVELANLDQFDAFRQRGVSSEEETGDWMRAFSEILLSPPAAEILRVID